MSEDTPGWFSFLERTVFRWIGLLWTLVDGWVARALAAAFLAGFALFVLLVVLMVLRGDVWAFIIYAENPYAHLAGAVAFFTAWWILVHGFKAGFDAWQRYAGRLVLLSMSLALSFLVCEIALRRVLIRQSEGNSLEGLKALKINHNRQKIRSDHPLGLIIQPSDVIKLVYELQPGLDLEFGHTRVRTNLRGMRDSRDYADEKPANALRILGMGDSGMFGWNIEQDGEYMSLLEKSLNARSNGIVYEVLNMAVPGYNTQLEVECLRAKGLPLKPDIVVVGWCENDGQLPFFLLEKEDFRRRDVSFLHMFLFRREAFRRVASGTYIEDLRNVDDERVVDEIKAGTEEAGLVKAFTELKQLADQADVRVLVFGPMGKGVRMLVELVGLPYYNTYEKIDKSKYPDEWEVHYMHPAPQGHALLAEHLEQELDRLGWLTPSNAAPATP